MVGLPDNDRLRHGFGRVCAHLSLLCLCICWVSTASTLTSAWIRALCTCGSTLQDRWIAAVAYTILRHCRLHGPVSVSTRCGHLPAHKFRPHASYLEIRFSHRTLQAWKRRGTEDPLTVNFVLLAGFVLQCAGWFFYGPRLWSIWFPPKDASKQVASSSAPQVGAASTSAGRRAADSKKA